MIHENKLKKFYIEDRKSTLEIAKILDCSESKVNYWLKKYGIQKRTISQAIYLKSNPEGDPFRFKEPKTQKEIFLFGLGIGLYWGEGTKASKYEIRLGNTDPKLLRYFLKFLEEIYSIKREKLRISLQLFNDIEPEKAQKWWSLELGIPAKNFAKPVITKSVSRGTYKKKAQYGVCTINFGNKKLRNMIMGEIEKLKELK